MLCVGKTRQDMRFPRLRYLSEIFIKIIKSWDIKVQCKTKISWNHLLKMKSKYTIYKTGMQSQNGNHNLFKSLFKMEIKIENIKNRYLESKQKPKFIKNVF